MGRHLRQLGHRPAGKDQAELDQTRWHLVVSLADELSQVLRNAPERGYSPRPRFQTRPADT
ncbi:MAG TPA: hypothetical protein VGD53_26855 [Actinoallomurus sp.]|jgi:hypothetical protein